MFDLEAAIRSWRDSFGESLRAEDLNELEEHLRAQVTALSGGELTEQEAFLVAHSRMGQNGELASEFAKVHAGSMWIGRLQWMILGFLGFSALVIASRVATGVTAWGASMFEVGAAGSIGATALVQVLGLMVLVWVLFRTVRSTLFAGRRLVLLALLFALLAPVLVVGRGALSIIQARTMTPEEMGYVIVHQSYVGTIATVVFPIALALVVFVLERRRRTV